MTDDGRKGVPTPQEGDVVVRAECARRGVAVFAADVTRTAREAEWRHLAGRVAAEALGRLMAAAALAGGFLQGEEQQSLQLKTAGNLKGALVDIDARGNMRGYTEVKVLPFMDLGPSATAFAIGSRGTLTAIRSTRTEVSTSGTVELVKGDIASDVELYLETSEQRPSIVEVATRYGEMTDHVGGLLVQAGPDADLPWFEALRARRADLARAVAEETDPERLVARVLAGEEWRVVERRPLRFRCRCTRARVEGMIEGMELAELKTMLAEDGGASVTCHFCNDIFTIDAEALRAMIARRESSPDAR